MRTVDMLKYRYIDIRISILDRVSSETSFDSKQPKMEPKLVSELSKKKCMFRLFRFQTETASFCVSIKPKQKGKTETNRKEPTF